jgi:hypothetical protein
LEGHFQLPTHDKPTEDLLSSTLAICTRKG